MGNVHGRLHYRPSMDNSLGRSYYRPRETWLVINHILIQITFLNLLGWFLIQSALLNMDDPYGRIGDELISRHPINYYYYYYYYYYYFGFEIIEINLE